MPVKQIMNTKQSRARRLYLIRHGQAGGDHYNKLTPVGESQARALGSYFARHRLKFSHAATGTLPRQQETYQLMSESLARESDTTPPPATVVPGLDEIEPKIWFTIGEELRHKDPTFRDDFKHWLASVRVSENRSVEQQIAYMKVLTRVIATWVRGDYDAAGIESFETFHNRVLATRSELPAGDGDLVVVSSGTPIALLIGAALGLELRRSLEFTRRVANTSLSIFELGNQEQWEPVSINCLGHLDAASRTEI